MIPSPVGLGDPSPAGKTAAIDDPNVSTCAFSAAVRSSANERLIIGSIPNAASTYDWTPPFDCRHACAASQLVAGGPLRERDLLPAHARVDELTEGPALQRGAAAAYS